ncbi:unnamed protein product [Moneuplotes crassus]|uniref:Uncharacterized protein n=1 Tax=Euplotes crassus TaxID=5936 RepID=A0AAD1UK17_EUPCR|nr:unnamed protein product [Moneuplotes crassus]
MEKSSPLAQSVTLQSFEIEKLIFERNRTVESMLFKSHCFNCFIDKVYFEESNSSSEREQISFANSICLNHFSGLVFTKKMPFLNFFAVQGLGFWESKKNKDLENFLYTSFPSVVDLFCIRRASEKVYNMSLCFSGIIRNSSRVCNQIVLERFWINHKQLKRLLASYSHVKRMRLWSCKISVPTPLRFSGLLRDSKINELDFNGSGNKEYSDWGNNLEQFRNLIIGLATYPGLKTSLNRICLSFSRIKDEDARIILTEGGLEKVKIWY